MMQNNAMQRLRALIGGAGIPMDQTGMKPVTRGSFIPGGDTQSDYRQRGSDVGEATRKPGFGLGDGLVDQYRSLDKESQKKFLEDRGLWSDSAWWNGSMWVNGDHARWEDKKGDGTPGANHPLLKWRDGVKSVGVFGGAGLSDIMRKNLGADNVTPGYERSSGLDTSRMTSFMGGSLSPNWRPQPEQRPSRPDERGMRPELPQSPRRPDERGMRPDIGLRPDERGMRYDGLARPDERGMRPSGLADALRKMMGG